MQTPARLAMRNISSSSSSRFCKGPQTSRQNSVAALLSSELKELNTAPSNTARKNPAA